MNSNRTLALLALVVLTLAYILFYERRGPVVNGSEDQTAKLLPAINPSAATVVEVVLRTNRIIRVERANDEWKLTMPLKGPAYAARIEGLLNAFAQLNRQSHISAQELLSQKQTLASFGLDPPLASIIVEQPRQRLEIKVGGKSPVGNQVYVQLVGSDGIFFTDAILHQRIPRSADDWRDHIFLHFKGLKFNRIEVAAKGGSTELQIDSSTQLWRLTKPMNARADNQKIAQLLRWLEEWSVARFLPEAPAPDLDALGLQTPEVALMLGQGTNDLLVAHFGKSPTNDASVVFARCLPDMLPVQVPRDVLDRLVVPFSEFREPHLVSAPMTAVEMIEIKAEESFALRRGADGAWSLAMNPPIPADPELVQNFLADLSALRIQEYVKDVVTDFAAYGLNNPLRQYALRRVLTNAVAGVTNPALAQVNFGSNKADLVYARLGDESSVYAVKWLDSWRLPTQSYQLRDRQIWNFMTNEVNSLTISYEGETRKLARNAARLWTLAPDPKPLGAPLTNILDETLYRLGRLRADAWVARGDDQLAKYGFPPVRHQISIELTKGGNPQFISLDFGGPAPSQNLYASLLRDGQRLVFEFRSSLYQLYFEMLRQLPPPPGAAKP